MDKIFKGNILEFMLAVGRLKSIKRTGWVRSGVRNPEHVADHMYMMAVMAFFIKDDHKLCRERCIKLALVHDMAECIVGDITPYCGVPKEQKHAKEKAAMEHLSSLAGIEVGPELFSLWQEYETQASPEACFVKNLDRFDMILQAHQYEKINGNFGHLEEFFNSTKGKFEHDMVKDWLEKLHAHRNLSYNQSSSTEQVTNTSHEDTQTTVQENCKNPPSCE